MLLHPDNFTFDINRPSNDGWTALHLAAYKGHATIVRILVQYGSPRKLDINRQDYDGRTALHLAASEGHDPIVRMLVQQPGAKLNIKENSRGNTPLLSTIGINKTHPSTMKILLEAGCCIEERDSSASTPLHLASAIHCTSSVDLLLEYGAKRQVKDSLENTPLLRNLRLSPQ